MILPSSVQRQVQTTGSSPYTNILDNNGNVVGMRKGNEEPTFMSGLTAYGGPGLGGEQITTIPAAPKYIEPAGGDGSFDRTSPDEFYGNLLKGVLSGGQTDYSGINQPLEEYRKYAEGLNPNAIPQQYADLAKGVGEKSEGQFQDYLKLLQTPSTAEEAIKQTESGILQQTLKDIDREIARSIADIKMTGEEYGISGAGRISEPITAAMAGAQGQGLAQKAGARSELAMSQLGRQAEKEKEVRQAYKDRYERGPVEEMMLAQAYPSFAKLQQDEKGMMYQMASAEADRRLQGMQLANTEKQNLIDNLFQTMLTGLEIESKESMTGGEFDLRKFLQAQQIDWAKEKSAAELKLKNEFGSRELDLKQKQIEGPGFWDSMTNRLPGLLLPTVSDFGGGSGIASIASIWS